MNVCDVVLPVRSDWKYRCIRSRTSSSVRPRSYSWRVDRLRSVNPDHDNLADRVLRTSCPVEGEQFGHRRDRIRQSTRRASNRYTRSNGSTTFTSTWALPPQVRESAGRPDVGEDEIIVVPDRRRSLGRQIRCSVRTNRGDEAKALLLDNSLHVGGQNPHGCVTFTLVPRLNAGSTPVASIWRAGYGRLHRNPYRHANARAAGGGLPAWFTGYQACRLIFRRPPCPIPPRPSPPRR